MIKIKNIKTLAGEVVDYHIPSDQNHEIEADKKLLLFPGIIDPHICLGSPDSESWILAVQSAVKGGMTTCIETPSAILPHNTKQDLEEKNHRITKGLRELQIPLNLFSYLLYSNENFNEIDQLGVEKKLIKGLVIHCEQNKKEVLDVNWENLFQIAAQQDVPIVINSYNENAEHGPATKDFEESLLEKALFYMEKWGNRLYVLNVATQKEIDLIQEARQKSLLVYAETTPQHLFPEDSSKAHHLWEAINQDVIETVGSGYHFNKPVKENFIFSNPLFFLPSLLTAVHEKKISIEKLVHLTSVNIMNILELKKNQDFILVDLEKEQTVQKINSGRSEGFKLRGWPIHTIVQGHLFS